MHIANTNFEWELLQSKVVPIERALEQHEIFLQLQFLPLYYADELVVTAMPKESFWNTFAQYGLKKPILHCFSDEKIEGSLESWGASLSVAAWAKAKGLHYEMADWEVVKKVNSKEFSFNVSPLPGSALLHNAEEFDAWTCSKKAPVVFKTCFGVSGRGHLILTSLSDLAIAKKRLAKEWSAGRPVIAEPWVYRLFDFSTQWQISKEGAIDHLGSTHMVNDARGTYQENRVGAGVFGSYLPFLKEHCDRARPVLSQMAKQGYFGNVGIDAFVYEEEGKALLHSIVEINARKTMGWFALQLQKRMAPQKTLSLKFLPSHTTDRSLLPDSLVKKNGRLVDFSRRLSFAVYN